MSARDAVILVIAMAALLGIAALVKIAGARRRPLSRVLDEHQAEQAAVRNSSEEPDDEH